MVFLTIGVLFSMAPLYAQVTTATLYGVVHDPSGAVLPGVNVTATNQGTNFSREVVADERGEFALLALPAGTYTLRIGLPGFKAYVNQGLTLGAGQVVRQTFALEVGQVTENITVAETAPLVSTASAAQQTSIGNQQVGDLPLARRNITNTLRLSAGVNVQDANTGTPGRELRMNGVGAGGVGITVDGTDATANPEIRGLGTYGGQNQIDVMSVEAVAEVQIAKGILPAEYGGVAGGQVNFLTRSGTNAFHGSVLENYQSEAFFARDPFLSSTTPKPSVKFNQYGGSLGGPIVKNRAMFFTAYEGYREKAGVSQLSTVPTQALRDQILTALPFQETKIELDTLPFPNEPVNAQIGRYRSVQNRQRHDNHIVAKGDVVVKGGNLSLTYNRMRPFTWDPTDKIWPLKRPAQVWYGEEGKDGTVYHYATDRIAAQFVLPRGTSVSETRFGWNRSNLDRIHQMWDVSDPSKPPIPLENISDASGRIGFFTISGLFGTPLSKYFPERSRTYNFEQKFSRIIGPHNVKVGFRWFRQGGYKLDAVTPSFVYNSLADLLANRPTSNLLSYGHSPHDGHLDEYGGFIQDDWRVNKKLVLNLGLRYDDYPTIKFEPKGGWPIGSGQSGLLNLNPPTDIRKLDFGSERPLDKPYDPEHFNFGPRAGFAWTLDDKGKTVLRGGSGVLYTAHVYFNLDFSVSDPYLPPEVQWNSVELAARGIKWPMYSEDQLQILRRETGGQKMIYSLENVHLPNPYTIQNMISLQREFATDWMVEVGYVHTNGRNFLEERKLSMAFDRETGIRTNPALGSASGYYKSSEGSMFYDALQLSVRRRLAKSWGSEFHYTLERGRAYQGGALASDFVNTDIGQNQDFFDWKNGADYGPLNQESKHRLNGDIIYSLPWFNKSKSLLSYVLGGWNVTSIISARSGLPMRASQSSGILRSRPDEVPGVEPVLPNWQDTLQYLNKDAFARVPTYPITAATIRPGTQNAAHLSGPPRFTVDMSLGKTIPIKESVALQLRADFFNAFNHVNYSSPDLNITSPTFGKITTATGARQGQIGAKLTF